MLQIHNSLTRRKERFEPIEPGKASLYVCGMTVYDYCHIGHARVMVVFDVVARYLRSHGYAVTYVRNITDIDDKIIKRAAERGESIEQLTEFFIQAMHEDAAALGVLPPDHEPRATTSINEIVAMIDALMKKDYAYRSDNGDVYYRVNRFSGYGRLSGKRLEDLRAGERVEVNEAKEDPLDFVLWKAAKPGEPQWPSPWGPGRPGWHIECSAMSTHCLGDHFDIHGGGMDLMFPHHENEIAQSEAATGHKFVNTWMHNGFVQIDEQKMSKSLGNFFTVREVLEHYTKKYNSKDVAGEIIRFFILNSHYRSPLNYSDENLNDAKLALDRFYTALRDISQLDINAAAHDRKDAQRFYAALDDDFNTSDAIAELFAIARDLNKAKAKNKTDDMSHIAGVLKHLGGLLGLLQLDPDEYFQIRRISGRGKITFRAWGTLSARYTPEEIKDLIAKRTEARDNKNWAESDRIRAELDKLGIVFEDNPQEMTLKSKDETEG